ncbi:MAG: energy transducer TonB, partial [Sphingobacteriales bacterium]
PSHPPNTDGMQHGPSLVDKMPTFPGGIKAYGKFLEKNLKWPKNDDDDTQGRVIISFYIEKDGSLTNFKVERSLGKDFDAEALRVLRKSPKWIPVMENGKAIRCRYTLPINFILTE